MKKQVIKEEAKQQLLKGAKLLYDAVSTTLGPMGENAVIQTYEEPIVTHDGVTVAKAIDVDFPDEPGVKLGVDMIKVSSKKSNDNVGDGTTSSTILAYHLINSGIQKVTTGKNSQVLRKEIEAAANQALKALDKISSPVDTEAKAVSIATISSENKEVGEIVGKMFYKLGKDAMVTVEIGDKPDIEHSIVEGYAFDRGVVASHMILDSSTNSTTIENPVIFISSKAVNTQDVVDLAGRAYNDGKDSFVIITDEIKTDLMAKTIKEKGVFDIIVIRAPGFGERRLALLEDIAKITNGKVYDGSRAFTYEDLGTCDKLVTTDKETVLTGCADATEHIKSIEDKITKETSEYEKQKLEHRVAQLKANIGVIKVGGFTEMAAEEKKHLVDDAVAATDAALKEGYVPGGGITYLTLANAITDDTDGAKLLKEALEAPFRVLMENGGHRPGLKLKELEGTKGMGCDAVTGEIVDLVDRGIIDPTLVIRQVITNAVSVSGSVLTTGVLITNKKEKSDEEED